MLFFQSLITVLTLTVATTFAAPHGLRGRCSHRDTAARSSSAVVALASNSASAQSASSAAANPSPSPSASHSASAHSTSGSAHSSSAAAPSSSADTGLPPKQPATGLLAALFPVSQSSSWSTSSSASNPLPLSDATFRPTKLIKALSHNYVTSNGKQAMQAHFPQGSYTFGHQPQGGLSFYAPGPADIDLSTAKEATFGYSVYFPSGFEFNKGGKLPGLYGGDSDSQATSCSGGRRDDGCFSARMMWRTEGAGEMYTYLPPSFSANTAVCNIPPFSTCNDVYGASVGRGSFTWATGEWTTISQRVRLNDAGQQNGELEIFVGGESVMSVGGLVLRDSSAGRIRGIQMQSFFGGSDSSWASPKDQDIFFSDFSVAITENL